MEYHKYRWAAMLGMALVCLMACIGLTARDPAAQEAGGNGLKGQYYDNQNLTAHELTRTDPTVNFSWGTGSPADP
jgi:hypothetical protein